MEVIGPNGNSIFFPAAGRRVGTSFEDIGVSGHYWQGTATNDKNIENMYYYDLNQVVWGLSVNNNMKVYQKII